MIFFYKSSNGNEKIKKEKNEKKNICQRTGVESKKIVPYIE